MKNSIKKRDIVAWGWLSSNIVIISIWKLPSYKYFDLVLVDNSESNDYYNKLKKLDVKVIKDNYQEGAKDRVISSRNKLREYFLQNDYDYLLSLEQDVVPPKDVIEKLVKHDKDICSGLYFKEKDKFL